MSNFLDGRCATCRSPMGSDDASRLLHTYVAEGPDKQEIRRLAERTRVKRECEACFRCWICETEISDAEYVVLPPTRTLVMDGTPDSPETITYSLEEPVAHVQCHKEALAKKRELDKGTEQHTKALRDHFAARREVEFDAAFNPQGRPSRREVDADTERWEALARSGASGSYGRPGFGGTGSGAIVMIFVAAAALVGCVALMGAFWGMIVFAVVAVVVGFNMVFSD